MLCKLKNVVFVLSLIATSNHMQAGILDYIGADVNYGLNLSGNIEKNAGMVINNGEYYALKSVSVQADNFKGSGLIDAPTIYIRAKKFEFSGTIRCYNQCVIASDESFDPNIFKREGPGNFVINTLKVGCCFCSL
jgi:hypothetical protein